MGLTELIASLSDNPYFGAGAGLFGIGALATVSKQGFQYGNILFRRYCIMSLEVTARDRSYEWLLKWISCHANKTQHLSVNTSYRQMDEGRVHTQYNFVPSVGDHFFRYKKHWIKVERHRETRSAIRSEDSGGGIQPWESVTLTALGRNKRLFFDILDSARELALQDVQEKTTLLRFQTSHWQQIGHPRRKRSIDSVVLEENMSQKILDDVKEFIDSPQWYFERGIPYRRGYLLYGPPGCGKSSFITALAGTLDYSIAIVSLSDGMDDIRLSHMLTEAPQQSIILLEDIDAAFIGRDHAAEEPVRHTGRGRLTFSGLLNALDGVASSEARILFMTTNHIDRLDPALIRPGRVDFKGYIGHCTDWQIKQMYKKFYPYATDENAAHFVNGIRQLGEPVSPALIQGYFMYHKSDPIGAIENINTMQAPR